MCRVPFPMPTFRACRILIDLDHVGKVNETLIFQSCIPQGRRPPMRSDFFFILPAISGLDFRIRFLLPVFAPELPRPLPSEAFL